MMRLMGVGPDVPAGWRKDRVRTPDPVESSQWRGFVGGAILVTMLQQLLVALFDFCSLGVKIYGRVSS